MRSAPFGSKKKTAFWGIFLFFVVFIKTVSVVLGSVCVNTGSLFGINATCSSLAAVVPTCASTFC